MCQTWKNHQSFSLEKHETIPRFFQYPPVAASTSNTSINVQEINSPPPDFFWLAIIKNYSMKNYMLQKCQINDNFAACNRIELFLEIGSQK